ncbi:hypothetical protein [Sulfurimonas sp.]|nr:hypothetical protein [Sulfurimonas sp.]
MCKVAPFHLSLRALYRELYSSLDNLQSSYSYAEEHLPRLKLSVKC